MFLLGTGIGQKSALLVTRSVLTEKIRICSFVLWSAAWDFDLDVYDETQPYQFSAKMPPAPQNDAAAAMLEPRIQIRHAGCSRHHATDSANYR